MRSVVVPYSHEPGTPGSTKPLLSVRLLGLSLLLLASTLFAASFLSSCRTADPAGPGNGDAVLVKTTVVGTVVDEAGKPVSGAAVSIHGMSTTSDRDGYFVIRDVSVPDGRAVTIARQNGYFTAAKAETPVVNGLTNVKLFLMSYGSRKLVSGSAGGTLTLTSTSGDASVKLPANALTLNGAAYTGSAQVAIRHLDPADRSFAKFFSGDQVAMRENGDRTELLSYGVLRVDMRTSSGEQLQLAADKPAEITYPIPANMLATAPASMPLWYFDEQQGLWVEEGVATKQGNRYVGTVKHFTDWNCDIPSEYNAILKGRIVCNGAGMGGIVVHIGQSYTYTDAEGRINRRLPAGVPLVLTIEPEMNNGLYAAGPIILDPLVGNETKDVGDIPLSLGCPSTITGTLKNEAGVKVPGKVVWRYGDNWSVVASTISGDFAIAVIPNTSVTLEVSSWVCSEKKSITVTSGNINEEKAIGDLTVCGVEVPVDGDFEISGFDSLITSVSLSPDGSMIAISGRGPVVVVRSTADGTLISTGGITGLQEIGRVQWTADGSAYLARSAYAGIAPSAVISATTGTTIREFNDLASPTILPDGQSVVGVKLNSGTKNSELVQVDVSTGTLLKTYAVVLQRGAEWGMRMSVNQDGSKLSMLGDSTMMIYDLVNDAILAQPAHPDGLWSYSEPQFSADGNRIAFASYGTNSWQFTVWDLTTGTRVGNAFLPQNDYKSGFGLHPDGNQIVYQKPFNSVWPAPIVANVTTGETISTLTTQGEPGMFGRFSYNASGSKLAGVYMNGDKVMIRVWNL